MNSQNLLAFRAPTVLPDRILPDGLVICRGDRIEEVRERATRIPKQALLVEAPAKGCIAPGFVDLQVHGGAGSDHMDGTTAAVRTANRAHLLRGTTTIFPTTTTGSPGQMERILRACRTVRDEWRPTMAEGARIGGVHLYGPFFVEKKVGAHATEGRRDPSREEFQRYFKLGIVKIATCAAELPGAQAFYRAAARAGCLITCGHSDASWGEMARAFAAGMRHVDHFWCAMSSVPSVRVRCGSPVQASIAEFVLANSEMSTEVIADGEHLSKELLEFAWRMKRPRRLCLVTDASRAQNMPPVRYRIGPVEDGSCIESNGKVGLGPIREGLTGKGLASTVVGMDTMIRNMKKLTAAPIEEVIRMATLTPAERAGIEAESGSLEPGKRADLIVLEQNFTFSPFTLRVSG